MNKQQINEELGYVIEQLAGGTETIEEVLKESGYETLNGAAIYREYNDLKPHNPQYQEYMAGNIPFEISAYVKKEGITSILYIRGTVRKYDNTITDRNFTETKITVLNI